MSDESVYFFLTGSEVGCGGVGSGERTAVGTAAEVLQVVSRIHADDTLWRSRWRTESPLGGPWELLHLL